MRYLEFKSTEAMMKFMGERTAAANAGLHPAQQRISYGDHWVRFDGLWIEFGQVATIESLAESEDSDVITHVMERNQQGYLYGLAYSATERHGVWGETHRADVWPIDEVLFEFAQKHDWVTKDFGIYGRVELTVAHRAWANHLLSLAKD